MNRDNRNEHWNDERDNNRGGFMGYDNRNTASDFGYGGHFGAGGSYGSFGGPASSRLNVPEQRSQGRTGVYNRDYDYQDKNRSGMENLVGGHRGKGPKGYQRSDQRILEDVNDRLSDDPHVDASDIDVKLENGTVILSGNVPDKATKRRAEDLAESVRGVSNIENRLHIGQGILANAARAFTSSIGDVTVGDEVNKK